MTDFQLLLPAMHTERSLRVHIEEHLGIPVSLVLTSNSTSMLSARLRSGELHVRLHRIFLYAEIRVICEIIEYLRNNRRSMPHFHAFVRENSGQLIRKSRRAPVRTSGRFHDLRALFDEINRNYFSGSITARITWGPRNPRASVRKRTVGSWSERSNLIRINPVLDKKTVPRFYIAFIIYHEMLHAALGITLQGKRRCIHSREFRQREKLFRDYKLALAWEGDAT